MNKFLKLCLLALAITPLIPDNTIFTPENSIFFMRTILVIIGVIFLIGFVSLKDFRTSISERIKIFTRNPLFVSLGLFVLFFTISTIFASDKYIALWSNTDRFEGLVGIMYLFCFSIFSLLIFKKEDYFDFFKLSLFVSFIVLIKEFSESFSGAVRPDSFIGNPTFLAGYLLFSIFCSILVFKETKNNFFKYFSVLISTLSIIGIFLTQTRGTLLGLVAGVVALLFYGAIKGRGVSLNKRKINKLSVIILCIIFVSSSIFIATRKNEVWQKVPGLSRVAQISSEDNTTKTRLIMGQISMKAVNPKEEGMKKFLIGWGPENFSLAYAKYFNPVQFKYEVGWFDRSHNRLLDVLVMTGLLGLLAYLSIWFLFFKFIFKTKGFSILNIGLIFFGVSLFVHLLFVFDQITTSVPFFIVLAFSIYLIESDKFKEIETKKKIHKEVKDNLVIAMDVIFLIQILFIGFAYFKNDLPAFIQIKEYGILRKDSEISNILQNINTVFDPFTSAQMRIRYDFMGFISKNYDEKNEKIKKLSDISLNRAVEYTKKVPLDLQFSNYLGLTYVNQGIATNDLENYKKAEEIFNRNLVYAPNKLDFNYGLAVSWFYQKRYDEAFSKFEQIFDLSPSYFQQKEGKGPEKIYTMFIKYFYDKRDKTNFVKTAKRLKDNGFANSQILDQIISIIDETGTWPYINFKND